MRAARRGRRRARRGVATAGVPDAPRRSSAPIHPDLLRAEAAARAAKGPEIYAALRDIWRHVGSRRPGAGRGGDRVVRGGIRGHAAPRASTRGCSRPTRGGGAATSTARSRAIARLGFVGRWMTLGPFDNENKAGFAPRLRSRGGARGARRPGPRPTTARSGRCAGACRRERGLRVVRLRRAHAPAREHLRLRDDVRPRQGRHPRAAQGLAVGGRGGRLPRLLERRARARGRGRTASSTSTASRRR